MATAQASNLIPAQNDFYYRKAGQLAADGSGASARLGLNVNVAISDSGAADEQWTKLQQAQEIVTAKVQPLHVNLPVRGQRLAFT